MAKFLLVLYVVFSAPLLFIALWIMTDLNTAIAKLEDICGTAVGD